MILPERDEASVLKPARGANEPRKVVERQTFYLYPADMYFSELPTEVTTVLGSCVAVTAWCPTRKSGGIFHALLPEAPEDVSGQDALRYVDSSLRELVSRFGPWDCARFEGIVFKAFGGAAVGPVVKERGALTAVGRRNVEVLREQLEELGIELTSYDLGGRHGRKLRFYTDTGEVLMKRLDSPHSRALASSVQDEGRRHGKEDQGPDRR